MYDVGFGAILMSGRLVELFLVNGYARCVYRTNFHCFLCEPLLLHTILLSLGLLAVTLVKADATVRSNLPIKLSNLLTSTGIFLRP